MLEPSSPAEVQAFEAWIRSDPAHARSYAEFDRIAAVGERLPRRTLAAEGAGAQRPFRSGWALAAALLVCVFASLLLIGRASERAEAAITNFGPSVRTVRLSDRTAAILDSGTEMSVRSRSDGSAVTLRRGRVRFRVRPGAGDAFTVSAGGAVVTARDSLLDVSSNSGMTKVWVLQGAADVAPSTGHTNAPATTLTAGHGADIGESGVPASTVSRYDASWPAARVGFENAPLASIVSAANRSGKPPINVPDGNVAALRVTAVLDLRDTRALARKLAATLDLRVEERHGAIIVKR